jgi:arylformamidase
MKTARPIAALLLAIGSAAALTSTVAAQEPALSKYSHVRIGGWLAYPPYVFTHQVWFRDIAYEKGSHDSQYTSLDVYVADPVEPRSPVMIFVHGGGLVMGDKASSKDLASKPEYFTSKLGFILVSVNYRLLPEGKYPRNVQDVADAIAWVNRNIADFGGDPNQIFLMGHSSGAQLVAQVSTDATFLKNAGLGLSAVKGVIAIEGDYGVLGPTPDIKALQESYGSDWHRALAINDVKAGAGVPPFLLMYVAGGSSLVPDSESQSLEFAKALKAASVRADTLALDHVEHFGANEYIGRPGDITTVSVERFLASIPGKKRAPKWTPGTMPKF